jgi:hypothetical protein
MKKVMSWKAKILLLVSVLSLMALPVARAAACDCSHDASRSCEHTKSLSPKKQQCDHHKKKSSHKKYGECHHTKKCDHKKSCEMKKKDCCARQVPPTNKKHHDKSSLMEDGSAFFTAVALVWPPELRPPPGFSFYKSSCFYHKNACLALHQSFLC